MKAWKDCLDEPGRSEVWCMCHNVGLSISQLRDIRDQSIKGDEMRPTLVTKLRSMGYSVPQIADALNRGEAWVKQRMGPVEPEKWGVTVPKHVQQYTVRRLKSGATRIEEV